MYWHCLFKDLTCLAFLCRWEHWTSPYKFTGDVYHWWICPGPSRALWSWFPERVNQEVAWSRQLLQQSSHTHQPQKLTWISEGLRSLSHIQGCGEWQILRLQMILQCFVSVTFRCQWSTIVLSTKANIPCNSAQLCAHVLLTSQI